MDDIKVALLVAKGDMESSGDGIHRYMHELYANTKRNNRGIGVNLVESGTYPLIGSGLSFMLGNMLKPFSGFDIIHNLDFKPLRPMLKGRSIWVSSVHDLEPLLYPEFDYDIEKGFRNRLWTELVIHNGLRMAMSSDHIIAGSTQTRDEILRLGYDKSRITILNYGVDGRFLRPARRSDHRAFRLGYIGAFRAKKNAKFAVKAFRQFESGNAVFEIWGKKEYAYNEMREAA